MKEPNMKPDNLTEPTAQNPTDQPFYLTAPFISKAEVARRLGKTTRTVEVWSKKGYLPFVKVGRSCLYRWPDIEARLLDNHGINCPPR